MHWKEATAVVAIVSALAFLVLIIMHAVADKPEEPSRPDYATDTEYNTALDEYENAEEYRKILFISAWSCVGGMFIFGALSY